MSTKTLLKTNKLIKDSVEIAELIKSKDFIEKMSKVHIDWENGRVLDMHPDIEEFLDKKGLIAFEKGEKTVTSKGLSLLGKFLVDIESLAEEGEPLVGRYIIDRVLVSGRNSVTFKAHHALLDRAFALKVIRPGKSDRLTKALKEIAQIEANEYLSQPLDVFDFDYKTVNNDSIKLRCLVIDFIEGDTLESFLTKKPPKSPYFVLAFIKQVSSALAALEKRGLYHGDLHANNILVIETTSGPQFRLIDISYGLTEGSSYETEMDDYTCFKEHLWRSILIIQRHLRRISIQKHLGAQIYLIVDHILCGDKRRFSEILELLNSGVLYDKFVEKRRKFLETKFRQPQPIGFFRHEEITDPQKAYAFFEPYPELMAEITKFGNAVIYGHRGSGKSTYLAYMGLFPEISESVKNIHKRLGIFFRCRQGEFRQFTSEIIEFTPSAIIRIKHIIILKIIRRVIDLVNSSNEAGYINEPRDLGIILSFLERYIAEGSLYQYSRDIISPLKNLHDSLLRNEIVEIDKLFSLPNEKPSVVGSLNETVLIEFFKAVKRTFSELNDTQFYILFDDAGIPNVPIETQRILNDIIRCVNSIFCIKLTSERFTYDFEDSSGKALEDGHDYTSYDISATLCLGSGFRPERHELKEYFEKIIARRLAEGQYRSFKIADYLGEILIPTDKLIERLADGRADAYYCGWDMVWQLADRTTRHLLELVSSIFSAASINKDTNPEVIKPRIQHHAIRSVSEKKLKSLQYIPGEININNKAIALGRQLHSFTQSFGLISRLYLKENKGKQKKERRYDERLAIERNDQLPLPHDAEDFLKYLIRYAILDDTKQAFARDDMKRKPIYIFNRIYCPAFSISFRRDQHVRLSIDKLVQFLLSPEKFVKKGTGFLRQLSSEQPYLEYEK
jgi:hypothetical protein